MTTRTEQIAHEIEGCYLAAEKDSPDPLSRTEYTWEGRRSEEWVQDRIVGEITSAEWDEAFGDWRRLYW